MATQDCRGHRLSVDGRLLSAQEVADYLGIPLGSLYQWRTKGTAPRAVKVGRHIRFRQEDLNAWIERQADEPARIGAA